MAEDRHETTIRAIVLLSLLSLLAWLLFGSFPVKAAGSEFTIWGYVTYDSPGGPPVPETVVRCNIVIDGVQHGTPPAYPGIDGYYELRFSIAAEQLRIYLETPADMEVMGNSSCAPCGPWQVNLIVCNSPLGNIGPINFFVRYLVPPTPTASPTARPTATRTSTSTVTSTATCTATPTVTPTVTQTNTPTATPTETPYLIPTAKPEGRPTPDTHLGVQQRKLEQNDELIAILRYVVYLLVGALTIAGYGTLHSKRS